MKISSAPFKEYKNQTRNPLGLKERITKVIACMIGIAVVLLILRLLVEWHADFLYNYFMRRMYEDLRSSEQQQEMMLMLMQTLSH